MALFSMAFGVSHIFAHNTGTHLVDAYGYEVTWYVMTIALVIAAVLIAWLRIKMKLEARDNRVH